EHAGVDADVRDGFSEGKCSTQRFAVFAGLYRSSKAHVVLNLLRSATFVNRRERKTSCEASGGGATIDPRELECDQGERKIFGSRKQSAMLGIHKHCCYARTVICREQFVLAFCPFVVVSFANGNKSSYGSTRYCTCGLDKHL